MNKKRLINIGCLFGINNSQLRIGSKMAVVPSIFDAYLEIEDGKISNFGAMHDLLNVENYLGEVIDLHGKIVMPTYVDCHTHLVFAESREKEFEDRLMGMTYQEIAERGGGILNSADKLANKSEDALYTDAMARLANLIHSGTGAIEIKSGYGLTTEAELKMLRVIKRIKETAPIPVASTYLGAHAYPAKYKDNHKAYLDEIIHETLPAVAGAGLADYVDVFCEKGYFELADTEQILVAASKFNLQARIHVNQFNVIGGVLLAHKMQAKSVEHLEVLSDEDLRILSDGKMFAVALPACSFFLKIPYTPARKLLNANVPFVLASDFNPGSSPTGNLNFVFSLACLYMDLTPSEAFNALTINAAHALDFENEVGSLDIGKRANFMVLPSTTTLATIPYHFADSVIEEVWINGQIYN